MKKITWEKVAEWDTPRIFWDEAGKKYTIDNAGATGIEDEDIEAGNYDYTDGAFAFATDDDGNDYRIIWRKIDAEKPYYDSETNTDNIEWDEAEIEVA